MAAVQLQQAPNDTIDAEPEENWDDDFEFQGDPSSNSGSRTSRKNLGPILFTPKLSVGSRAETEDWDADVDVSATRGKLQDSAELATSTSTLKPQTLSPNFALRNSPGHETENWDDDFLDARNSPQKPTSSFPPRSSSLLHPSPSSPPSNVHPQSHIDEPPESWDDDLELNDAEFGLAEHEEEDRTVTARSRRSALSRAAARAPSTPPPPTPKLPRGLAGTGAFLAPDQPFPHAQSPHSPTSSVFSVPATVRTTGSNVPLFASSSAAVGQAYPSASARVFSLLPPSPQVHKERERRRLRKRSRPGEREERDRRRERDGVFELVEVAEGRMSGAAGGRVWDDDEYGYGYGRRSMDSERALDIDDEEHGRGSSHGHADPVVPPDPLPPAKLQTGASSSTRPSTAPTGIGPPPSGNGYSAQIQSVPATPTKHTLLSRIGSVKRWAGAGVRRRRGMSTGPDEIIGDLRNTDASNDPSDTHRTPRPQSSMSSFTNHDSGSSYSHHHQPPSHPHAASTHPYNHHRHSTPHPRSPSTPGSPSKSPQETRAGNSAGGDSNWFFRSSSRTSSTASPTGPARRAFRSTSRSTPADSANDVSSTAAPSGSRRATASPPPAARRRLSRSGSRRGHAEPNADAPRTPRRAAGDRDGSNAATPSSQWNGVGVGRRPSSRATGLEGRKSMRASLDFNASRTSLGMSMNILEAQERERARDVYTPSPSVEPGKAISGPRILGRGRGYSVGGKDKDAGKENEERTPAKLIKRKSLGFVQLGRAAASGYKEEARPDGADVTDVSKEMAEDDRQDDGKQARYGGLGIGRAFGLGKNGAGGEDEREKEIDERKRRKSFSRFLKDNGKDRNKLPQTPSKDKEKEGSRGFMGSVRRISLVGKHKRTKSGSGLALGSVPPSPSSPFFSRHASSGTPASGRGEVPPVPYALPPLPASSTSQLSLRLPSSSSSYLPLPPHPLGLGGKRIVSTASSQSQGSSVLPASSSGVSTPGSTSANSSRNPSANGPQAPSSQTQKTPTQPQQPARRPSSRRSRVSEEGAGRPSLVSSRQSIDFEARIRRSIDQEISESGKEDGQGARYTQGKTNSNVAPHPESSVPPMPLLPPIELQPPSPPQTIGPAASGTGKKPAPLEADAMASGSLGATLNTFDSLSPTNSSSSLFFTPTSSPQPPSSPNKLSVSQSPGKSPGSQQSASLGRVTAATAVAATEGASGQGGTAVPRRNSLGDLKIPARISQAQVGIKRDLGLVREFANSVDQLKELQETYNGLIAEIQSIFESHVQRHVRETPSPLPRTTSPSFFANLSTKAKPKTRARSNTNPTPGQISMSNSPSMQDVTTAQFAYKEMASTFYTINSKYRISWECAELLIELGGGTPSASATSPPPSSASVPLMIHAQAAAFDNTGKKKSRERAVTLAGDQSKPYPTASTSLVGSANLPTSPPHPNASPPPASPPNMSWRASTGRHDLSQRQLVLLREMLNNANATSIADESHLSIPEESLPSLHSLHAMNKDWRWGDARNSTITLPSEESSAFHPDRHLAAEKKRKGGKLGMAGIRDMLRALKRSHTESDAGVLASSPPSTSNNGPMSKALHSTASLSTQSSAGSKSHRYAHPRLPSNRRRAKASIGPDTLRASQDLDRDIPATSSFANPSFTPKPSARRPSLASIFRIGNRHRPSHVTPDDPIMSAPSSSAVVADEHQAQSSGTGEDSSGTSEEDWDRMDSASDLDAVAKALSAASDGTATVRGGSHRQNKGRSPYLQPDSFEPPPSLPLPVLVPSGAGSKPGYSMRSSIIPKRSFNMSSSSLRNGEPSSQGSPHGSSHMPQRTIRLSNVEEHTDERTIPIDPLTLSSNTDGRLSTVVASPLRPSSIRSKPHKTGSVRSMPPQFATSGTVSSLQDPKLAMTPENIKPLLENAKEVLSKLNDCIAEIRALINLAVIDGDV